MDGADAGTRGGLFNRAKDRRASIADLLSRGSDADVLDPCGASPLWYAARSLDHAAALVLRDAGADAGRRIELSAQGERFTTILHEIVLLGRTVALDRALARGVDPSLRDSDGAAPIHRPDKNSDHVNPSMVRSLVAAGADVNATTTGGQRPIEAAAQRVLPATVATMLELDALPALALTAVLHWWVMNVRWAAYRAREVVDMIEILRVGDAEVTEQDLQLATAAGVPEVIVAVNA